MMFIPEIPDHLCTPMDPTMKKQNLSIDLLRIDGGTQSRLAINDDVVQEYAELIANSEQWPFPPVDVFHDGTDYHMADGFHRKLAAVQAKKGSIPCNVHEGTATAARIFGMTANDRHGLRMSQADKRACVHWMLDTFPKMTQKEIGEKTGVSARWVKQIVADRNADSLKGRMAEASKTTSKGSTRGSSSPSTPESSSSVPTSPPPAVHSDSSGGGGEDPLEFHEGPPAEIEEADLGKCPNCAGTKWTQDEDGTYCANCRHPYGEPTGGADEERIKTQRSKTVKTVEALQRAFDDLNLLLPRAEHKEAADTCKVLLRMAKGWK